jgi:hypothetical protein
MGRDIRQIVAEIDALPSVEGDDLNRLQLLFDEYYTSSAAASNINVWFRLYERFPDEHGHGVFWTILHGIESLSCSDAAVVSSVCRRPMHYSVLMVNRMLNGGISTVDGVDLLALLRQVALDNCWPADVREDALGYLEYQRNRAEQGSAENEGV